MSFHGLPSITSFGDNTGELEGLADPTYKGIVPKA
jgi:hypothetical protein